MLQSADDAPRVLAEGRSLLGPGWKAVDSFDDLEDVEDFEEEEEEVYVTMDLSNAIDNRTLQSDTQYQLIGLDTPLPFLRFANQIYQGELTPLIGDEVILGLIRNQENPHNPSHPPIHATHQRLTFRPVTLRPFDQAEEVKEKGKAKKATEEPRSIFMMKPATKGRNKPGNTTRPSITPRPDDYIRKSTDEPNETPLEGPAEGEDVLMEMDEPEAGPSRLPDKPDKPVKEKGRPKGATIRPKSPPRDPSPVESVASEIGLTPAAEPAESVQEAVESPAPKRKGRPPGLTNRYRIIVHNAAELEQLDLDSLAVNARLEISPAVQYDLGFNTILPKGVTEKTTFTRKEIGKLKAGNPMRGPGSRGGKGTRGGRPFNTRTTRKKDVGVDKGEIFLTVGGEAGDGNGDEAGDGDGDDGMAGEIEEPHIGETEEGGEGDGDVGSEEEENNAPPG